MPKSIPEQRLQAIELVVSTHPNGVNIQKIQDELGQEPCGQALSRRTLQYWLARLVSTGRLVMEGEKRGAKYRLPMFAGSGGGEYTVAAPEAKIFFPRAYANDNNGLAVAEPGVTMPVSQQAAEVRQYVRQTMIARKPVAYQREFLDGYKPNRSAYLSNKERAHLRQLGTDLSGEQPAGTHAKQILTRLLIDLSWNSSRLEGNTYSLLDTTRLLSFGAEAEGKAKLEAQMILNHKDAIEFLVDSASMVDFDRRTILNLHALLANNLLPNPAAIGGLRQIPVGIGKSVFHPLASPPVIEECFTQLLATAAAIKDPFEQALFAMVQLPYLQPFEDVNKRVSRLAANLPLIRANLIPLSFVDVPAEDYTEAMLGVYEMQRPDLLKEVFIWAYEHSAIQYRAVRQTLGDPDPFRLKHRLPLKGVIRVIVQGKLNRKTAFTRIADWAREHIAAPEQEKFREVAENEILSLHEGNFARYQITLTEFLDWEAGW
ncbi:MAG: Fic family protein [Pseudomonadales bacterium]